ncbi:MAG: hypothetical protein JXB07_10900 [Anaerolineae bacterium]|nr:hypothetical protein [Anaerolineae bacterium]
MKPLAYHELRDVFIKPGCAICNLLKRDIEHYIDTLLYEFTLDLDVNKAFREGRGFCNEHGNQILEHKGSSLSIAILYQAIVSDLLKVVDQASGGPSSRPILARLLRADADDGLAAQLGPSRTCMACDMLAEAEGRYVQALSEHIGDEPLREKYEQSEGLCLSHFRKVLRQTRNPAHYQIMISTQQAIWVRLKAELDEFIAKNDYQRTDPMGVEGDSWSRAARRIAGEKGIFGLDRREG